MKVRDVKRNFDMKSKVISEIVENMNYKHNVTTLISLLKFIENIYKQGYTVSKYQYIRYKRPDIMNAIKIIDNWWSNYLLKKKELKFSMEFDNLRLDDIKVNYTYLNM